MKTYKFKLYHQKKTKHLDHQLLIACNVYNHCIALCRRYYKLYKKSLHKYKLSKHLTKLKNNIAKYNFWNEIPAHAIQNITERIHRAYKLWWSNLKRKKKGAPPKFRRLRKYKSFSYDMVGQNLIKGNKIKIAGKEYKFSKSREIEGKIKLLTIKRDSCGDYFVYLVCDTKETKTETRLGESIGFDFGFKGKMLVAESPKDDISAPNFFFKQKIAVARANRKLSLKRPRSNNRRKAKLELARLHRKIANQRRDYHWKLARKLCMKYSILCFEDLNMRWMQKNHGKKVMDYGFAEFLSILEYVAPQFGTQIVRVDKFYPSSQICNGCGYQNTEIKDLRIRQWNCPSCGKHHDRDRNAAANIHSEGLRLVSETA
uniref:Endonuclease n=1 Tax=Myoviridae sp. ctqfO1 TaxID=2827710 RepID=A0A8S5T2G2_9CAUD|nr:MAG TPA: endonuclease [Myoviridae sp. ctqfO1]